MTTDTRWTRDDVIRWQEALREQERSTQHRRYCYTCNRDAYGPCELGNDHNVKPERSDPLGSIHAELVEASQWMPRPDHG